LSWFILAAAIAVGVVLMLGLHRIWAGPSVFDRLVAVALVTANTLVLLLLAGSVLDQVSLMVDIALAYALLAFTLPVALGKHYESRFARGARTAHAPGVPRQDWEDREDRT
jgi:multicomponent Na+:H+ antiporter subunit F